MCSPIAFLSSNERPGGGIRILITRLRLPWGRYSILGNSSQAPYIERMLKQTTAASRVNQFIVTPFTSHIMPDSSQPPMVPKGDLDRRDACLRPLNEKSCLANIGMTETETNRLNATAKVTAIAISLKS